MSGEGVAVQSPNLVLALAIHDFHILAHGFLGRGKAESLVGYGEHATALLGVNGNVGCKPRFQFQISIWSRNHYLVSYYVVGSCSFQAHLLHGSLEGIIRIGIYGEGYSVAFLYTADISLVNIGNYLHIGQVLCDGEEFWGVEAGCYGLTFLYALRNHGDEIEEGMKILRNLYAKAKEDKREEVPVSKLRVGLKCGGSDGFSGITANPLVGEFSDWLVAQGGTSILTEVPEMFGAETILMNRCENKELFNKTVHLINDFKEYFLSHGEPVGENPSPGNKAGGISTLEDKALGCTQKCGRAPVSGVLQYGDRLETTGLNLLSAPGNDLVAATALASAGCQLVLFTTGRGTPFGTFVPTMKISTNSKLAQNKPNWIDFNAGELVEGTDMKELVNRFIDKIIAVASGEEARNEYNGYREISIFKNGVTL